MSDSKQTKSRKQASKKETNPTTPKPKKEVSEKTKLEQANYNLALKEISDLDYIGNSNILEKKNYEKLASKFYLMVLEHIKNNKNSTKSAFAERYPNDKYVTFDEKINPVKKVRTAAVKEEPVNKQQHKKKGQPRVTNNVVSDSDEENLKSPPSENESQANEKSEKTEKTEKSDKLEKDEAASASSSNPEQKAKRSAKKNVFQIGKKGKVALAVICNKYIYEIYSNEELADKKLNMKLFTKFVYNINNFPEQLSRNIVYATTAHDKLTNYPCHIESELRSLIVSSFDEDMANDTLKDFAANVLVKYFKLLALYISKLAWTSKRTIDNTLIESVMLTLDIGYETSEVFKEEHDNYHEVMNQIEYSVLKLCPTLPKSEKKSKSNKKGKDSDKADKDESTSDKNESESESESDDDSDKEESDDEPDYSTKKKIPKMKGESSK